jgi:hypothetical protein
MARCERGGASHRKEGGTRHPQIGNCGAPDSASMFTQVNFRGVSKIRFRWGDCDISDDKICLRQVARGIDSRKRVEAQELAVNQQLHSLVAAELSAVVQQGGSSNE